VALKEDLEKRAGGPGHRNHLNSRGCPVQALLGRARNVGTDGSFPNFLKQGSPT
jgi:hypothetical protein